MGAPIWLPRDMAVQWQAPALQCVAIPSRVLLLLLLEQRWRSLNCRLKLCTHQVPMPNRPRVADTGLLTDCCDGSDEAAVKCPNTCKEKGAEAIKALKAEVAAAEAGVKAKERYISQAGGIKKGWQQRLSALEGEIEKQQKLVDELAGEAAGHARQRRQRRQRQREREQGQLGPQGTAAQGAAAQGAVAQHATAQRAAPEAQTSPHASSLGRLLAACAALCLAALSVCAWLLGLGRCARQRRRFRPAKRQPGGVLLF